MPVEFFYVILLLVVAVVFGYFYLKRAQGRPNSSNVDASVAATPPPCTAIARDTCCKGRCAAGHGDACCGARPAGRTIALRV